MKQFPTWLDNRNLAFLPVALIATIVFTPTPSAQAATIVVDSPVDGLAAGDGRCTLREAIMNANLPGGGDTTMDDCVSGDPGTDTITFDNSLDGVPIVLNLVSSDEQANADGDLDITDDLIGLPVLTLVIGLIQGGLVRVCSSANRKDS